MTSARIKFVSGDAEPDLVLELELTDRVDEVLQKIRQQRGIHIGQHLRVICAGKELYPGETLPTCHPSSSLVLHCMVTEGAPQRAHSRPPVEVPPPVVVVEPPPVDWLDVVEPGTVLMWIFGSILALLWLLFIFYAHMFDRTSVVMLIMMSVAFLIPCFPSHFSWLSFLNPPPAMLSAHDGDPHSSGHSTALHGGTWNGQPIGPGGIPPRPSARVRPPAAS